MTEHQSDALLFLRLAGTRFGVRARHIPIEVIATAANLGGQVRFQSDRVFVRNSRTAIARLHEIRRHGGPSHLDMP